MCGGFVLVNDSSRLGPGWAQGRVGLVGQIFKGAFESLREFSL